MMRTLVLIPLLPLLLQDKEYEFKWGLARDMAADYAVFDTSKGRPVPKKDRFFMIFGPDLKDDGTNNLLVNTYDDLPWHFVFQLPKGKVKAGSRWTLEEDLFEPARQALSTMHAFKPVAVRGVLSLKKIEKMNDVECARVDGVFQLFEIKIDSINNKRSISKSQFAQFSTVAWLSLENTVLVKGGYDYNGKGDEYKGIKQGEEPKTRKMDLGELIEIKKELVKVDQVAHLDRIHGAIKKGVEALRKMQRKDGSWQDEGGSFARDFPAGMTGLCTMALVHSGVKVDDPQVRMAFAYMQKAQFKKVYDVAATIMAFETKYLPLEKFEDVQSLTEQGARDAIAKAITKEDLAYLQKAVDWLVGLQTKDGTWGYPEQSENYDHSNTQYAMLALKSAARCGIKIRADVWKKAANHWIASQRVASPKVALKLTWLSDEEAGVDTSTRAEEQFTQGPWGYFTVKPVHDAITDNGYGSMTCAGLTSLLVAESELVQMKELDDALRKKIDQAKKQGLAWLQENFTVRGCPPQAGFWSVFYTYYLYSLERVGVLYGIRKFGDHDWYQEGALVLVHQQRDDGSWNLYVDIPVLDTAFALLFLKKATIRVSTRAATPK